MTPNWGRVTSITYNLAIVDSSVVDEMVWLLGDASGTVPRPDPCPVDFFSRYTLPHNRRTASRRRGIHIDVTLATADSAIVAEESARLRGAQLSK